MRSSGPLRLFLFALTALVLAGPPHIAHAQGGGGHGGGQGGDSSADDEEKDKKRQEEWGTGAQLDVGGPKNDGPCPYVKVLYDAARYVDFKGGQPAISNVGYTGEIENLTSACAYKGEEPIRIAMQVLFEFGRGPQAEGSTKTYHYWVAVTDRNVSVLDKRYFDVTAHFAPGEDRTTMTDTLQNILIPRADHDVSGANFEILVGFDVTPEMVDFNRQGKRFHPDAHATAQNATAPAAP